MDFQSEFLTKLFFFHPSSNKNLQIALIELPCAAISMFLLFSNLLRISFLKYGNTLSYVSFRDSASGIFFDGIFL